MKKLSDYEGLFLDEQTITLTELRANPGDVFTQVSLGAKFTVTKNGKVIATINPPEPTALELGAALRRSGKGRAG